MASARAWRRVSRTATSTDLLLNQADWNTIRELHVPPSMEDGCFYDPLARP